MLTAHDFDETTPPPKGTVLKVADRHTWDEVERVYGPAVRARFDPSFVPEREDADRVPVGSLDAGATFLHNCMIFRLSGREHVGKHVARRLPTGPVWRPCRMLAAEYVGDVVGRKLQPIMFGMTVRVVNFGEHVEVVPFTPDL